MQGNVDCDMKYTREKSHKKAFSGTLNFLLNVLQKHLIFATLGRSMQSCIRKVKWPIISAICDFLALLHSGTKTDRLSILQYADNYYENRYNVFIQKVNSWLKFCPPRWIYGLKLWRKHLFSILDKNVAYVLWIKTTLC